MGTYELHPDHVLVITLEDNQLFVHVANQPKLALYAESKRDFFLKELDAQIRFERGENRSIPRLIFHQEGQDHPADRRYYYDPTYLNTTGT